MNIAVVGDSIVDEYFYVKADKISPEFPIPVLQSENDIPHKCLPGGAANVCYQFLNFNKEVFYFGFVDFESLEVFDKYFLTDNCVLLDNYRKVPRKKRFYQDSFPLCRVDVESNNYNLGPEKLNLFQKKICDNLSNYNFDMAIFSDYGKGIFHDFDIKNYFNSVGNALKIVDPKHGPASKWLGCDIIKPNYKEAKEISGKSFWKDQVLYFKEQTNARVVIVTQGGDGIVGMINDEFFEFRPQFKTVPTSVIGAGDCFVSLLAIGLSDNLGISQSIQYAFYGSSLYVKNKHNKPIHPADLFENKIIKNPEILFNRNFTLCFTNGCFDFGLTPAHIELLRFAKCKKEKLVVALNSDLSVEKLKGQNRPILKFSDRAEILAALDFVDYIVEFEENTPIEVINKIKPDLIIKGGDYKKEEVVGFENYPVEIFNYINCPSTTEKIKNFNFDN